MTWLNKNLNLLFTFFEAPLEKYTKQYWKVVWKENAAEHQDGHGVMT